MLDADRGPDPDAVARLGEALVAADYTPDGVAELLGASAHGALARGETVPAERATRGGSSLETLVRLFLLQRAVPTKAAAAALPLGDALTGGLLAAASGPRGGDRQLAPAASTRDGDPVVALVDLRPYDRAGWWVVSDHGTGMDGRHRPLPPDHVLGVGGASTSLASLTVRPEVGRALDLGTGCGVQALHLSEHAARVTATDVLPRAVAMARLTAALSGVRLDLRQGDLLAPVAGECFDLLVSNPPFVVGGDGRHPYRDSGLPGDEVSRRLVAEAPRHLAPGGWAQLLANWVHRPGQDWRERVGDWLPPGCDAWVVQREVQDPAEYVGLWLRDSGDIGSADYPPAYDAWLGALEAAGVAAVGFGWVTLHRTDAAAPNVRIEDWPHPVEQSVGPYVHAWFARASTLRAYDDQALLGARLTIAPGMVQEQFGAPGAEHPQHLVLRQQRGLRRAERVGTAEAGLVGACDGTLTVDQITAVLAQLLDEDPEALRLQLLPRVRRFVEDGFLQLG